MHRDNSFLPPNAEALREEQEFNEQFPKIGTEITLDKDGTIGVVRAYNRRRLNPGVYVEIEGEEDHKFILLEDLKK